MIFKTPWDTNALGVDCYEISNSGEVDLKNLGAPGHYTVKVDPLSDKSNLHKSGFYYCDTLVTTFSSQRTFKPYQNSKVSIANNCSVESIAEICIMAFQHGRFHRDFNVTLSAAEQRYEAWATSLVDAGCVTGLIFEDKLVGFIASQGAHLVLHAIKSEWRGRGLSKYLWTPVCENLYKSGASEVTSSISASNIPILNLYSRLGFGFKDPLDVYHKVVL